MRQRAWGPLAYAGPTAIHAQRNSHTYYSHSDTLWDLGLGEQTYSFVGAASAPLFTFR